MANEEIFTPIPGPSGNALLRQVFIETGQAGTFRPTIEEAGLNATSPSQAASQVAAVGRICAADRPVFTDAGTTPTQQPTATNNGAVFIGTKGSANQTYTLPAAQVAGLNFTFIGANAAGELLVNPVGTDTLAIKATVDQGASVVTAAGVGIKNTAATNVAGDLIVLISDGVSQWHMIGQSGIWASQ